MRRKVRCEVFRGAFTTWDRLFERASAFATSIGRDRLISISHSSENMEGVVTVWYWGDEDTDLLGLNENE